MLVAGSSTVGEEAGSSTLGVGADTRSAEVSIQHSGSPVGEDSMFQVVALPRSLRQEARICTSAAEVDRGIPAFVECVALRLAV